MSVRPGQQPRGSGDAWVEAGDGRRFWGRFGAAGLMLWDRDKGILLQHRAEWSHFGGTWGLPGGARHEGESAVDAAVREAGEEAGVPADAVRVRFSSLLDLGFWSYTTVVAEATRAVRGAVTDAESLELRWVAPDEVGGYPLHPGFAESWPELRAALGREVLLVVDAANVVGSRPDGWWRDRVGATSRLIDALAPRAIGGFAGGEIGLANHEHFWAEVALVVEGQAKAVADSDALRIVRAPHDGDTAVVDTVERSDAAHIMVVTADHALADRVARLGAAVIGPGRLWQLLDA